MRILAIDHGSKNIGLALSDPSGLIAQPLPVLRSRSYLDDTAKIVLLVEKYEIEKIIIGLSVNEKSEPTFDGRRSLRFAQILKNQCALPIIMWDESFTTADARISRIHLNVNRKKRSGHLDSIAATILLQSYIEHNLP